MKPTDKTQKNIRWIHLSVGEIFLKTIFAQRMDEANGQKPQKSSVGFIDQLGRICF